MCMIVVKYIHSVIFTVNKTFYRPCIKLKYSINTKNDQCYAQNTQRYVVEHA